MAERYTVEGQLRIGNLGENQFLKYLKEGCPNITDVVYLDGEEYKHLRKYDIDFVIDINGKIDKNILFDGDIDKINTIYRTIELKTDEKMHSTKNVFLEDSLTFVDYDGVEKEIDGFMKKSKASYLFYCDYLNTMMYYNRLEIIQDFYFPHINEFEIPKKPVESTLIGSNIPCKVYGHKVPLERLLSEGILKECKEYNNFYTY